LIASLVKLQTFENVTFTFCNSVKYHFRYSQT